MFEQFFQPLSEVFKDLVSTRKCGKLTDWEWILGGVMRVISKQKTGRGFLQCFESWGRKCPQLSHYFETLKSARRLRLCQDVAKKVAPAMIQQRADALACFPCLQDYEVYAGDGHFHAAACHDARKGIKDIKYATGHLSSLNLRTHALAHLKVGDVLAKKEHDMKGLKSLSAEDLRHQAPKGTKVLIIWDRAGIDFGQWWRGKKSAGIYFISRLKDNMKPLKMGMRTYDVNDPLNSGVLSDEYLGVSVGVTMRRVKYQDAVSGEEYDFITSDMDLPPGMIAHLYRMRWDIEKVFDEVKNKSEEKKSWASTETTKAMQIQFICLAHNLMILMEDHLEEDWQITNLAEAKRRQQRMAQQKEKTEDQQRLWPQVLEWVVRLTREKPKIHPLAQGPPAFIHFPKRSLPSTPTPLCEIITPFFGHRCIFLRERRVLTACVCRHS